MHIERLRKNNKKRPKFKRNNKHHYRLDPWIMPNWNINNNVFQRVNNNQAIVHIDIESPSQSQTTTEISTATNENDTDEWGDLTDDGIF